MILSERKCANGMAFTLCGATCSLIFRWFGGTQMETSHARKVLPCWDEPSFKATFDITLGHEGSMSAISNMPETSTKSM